MSSDRGKTTRIKDLSEDMRRATYGYQNRMKALEIQEKEMTMMLKRLEETREKNKKEDAKRRLVEAQEDEVHNRARAQAQMIDQQIKNLHAKCSTRNAPGFVEK